MNNSRHDEAQHDAHGYDSDCDVLRGHDDGDRGHWPFGLNLKDWLFGGPGDDFLFGGNGKDVLIGGRGNDLLIGGNGKDVLFGGQGDDQLYGGNGKDLLIGGEGDDELDGGRGNDLLIGGDGVDVLRGGAGNDVLIGGSPVELLRVGGPEALDWADYSDAPSAVSVNLATGIAQDGTGGTDLLFGIRGVIGSAFDDVFIGSDDVEEYFRGGAGNDLIDGGTLADLQSDHGFKFDYADYSDAPAAVNVDLATGSAQDGAGGVDTLIGIEGVIGSAYDDVLIGSGAYAEHFRGGPGDDLIDGAGSFDRALYSDASGPISVDLAAGTVTGDASVGHDTLIQIEQITGTDYADSYVALGFLSPSALGGYVSNFNAFEGRGGDDVIAGNGGTRIEYAGATGPVTVNFVTHSADGDASVGHDSFTGVNQVRGSEYADLLIGGNPATDGFEGYEGRGGDDTIVGGSGYDRADYALSGPLGVGIAVDLAAGIVAGDPLAIGTDTLSGVEAIRGSYKDDLFDATGFSGSSTNAGSFGTFNDFEGMAGDDTIIGNGNTRLSFGNAREAVSVDLSAGIATGGASVGHDTIMGGVFNVRGSNFDDTLIGTDLNDNLDGGNGNDLLIGGAGDDQLLGQLGNDTLRGAAGYDFLNGGLVADFQSDAGFEDLDRADYRDAPAAVNVDLAMGFAQDGFGTFDNLYGIEGVIGSPGDDTLTGSSAFQEFFRGEGGDDLIDGGLGFDRAEYADASGPITVDMAAGTVAGDVSVGNDTLRGIEIVQGTNFADSYTATGFFSPSLPGGFVSSFNAFEGRGGNDVIVGNGGTRIEYVGATGPVTVDLAAHTADGDASVGHDTFSGVNQVRGSEYADTLLGGNPAMNGFEGYDGRGGDDYIDGGDGYDRADYYSSNGAMSVGLNVHLAEGTVSGDPLHVGTDTLRGIEAIRGSYQNDLFDATGFSGASTNAGYYGTFNDFEGMAGDDTIIGNGNTRLSYGLAREYIIADLENGNVFGGASVGHDSFSGVNSISGSNFDDVLFGSPGDDVLFGGNGNDLLRGFAGNDFLSGGVVADYQSDLGFQDDDTVDYSDAPTGVTVDLGAGYALDGYGGFDSLVGFEGVVGSWNADTLIGSATYAEHFRGGGGNDFIDGGLGFDKAEYTDATSGIVVDLALGTVTGDASVGSDMLSGVELIEGSDHADSFSAIGFSSPSLPGGFWSPFNAFEGGAGDDTITGNGATRIEYTSATGPVSVNLALGVAMGNDSVGSDMIVGGVNAVRGSDYDDNIVGGNLLSDGFEQFDGRGGNDWIDGGTGYDQATYNFVGPLSGGIQVDLAAGTVTGDPLRVGTDSLHSIEAVRGSYLDDVYDSTGFSPFSSNAGSLGSFNEFEGMAGNDLIIGNGNTRVSYVLAREGVTVDLAAGYAAGGPSVGFDTIAGGVSQIRGSNFDDMLSGTNHGLGYAEIYDGRGGNDTFSGNGGYDQADYGDDPTSAGIFVDMDAINSYTGTVSGDFAIGFDTLIDIPSVRGTAFADFYDGGGYQSFVTGIGAFNEFLPGGGDDVVIGNGVTRVSYVSEWSAVTVDLGAGTASGLSTGDDTLINVFRVRGSNLDDSLTGSGANDVLDGWAGNDTIDGGGGFDLVRYDFAPGPGFFTVDAMGVITAAVGWGTDTVSNVESVRGTNSSDHFNAAAYAGGIQFDGRGGDDIVTGSAGADRIIGGAGADAIDGGPGSDQIEYDALFDAGDRIFGFATGPGGDVLDIANLLAGWTTYNNGAGGPLEDYVRVVADAADALLQIDPDGGGGAGWQTLATLDNGAGIDLNALLAGGNIDYLV
jgi:Ca2+-binding RTX toxin-like protein